MKVFAISDLHLSLTAPYQAGSKAQLAKPMEVFGSRWDDYFRRMDENWRSCVGEQDAVLIAGDLSWAMTLDEIEHDFAYLGSLPGRKVICKGNHDYWWNSLSRVRNCAPAGLEFLQHSAINLGPCVVCGTRGWLSPQHAEFKSSDKPIYDRELLRLRMALEEAVGYGLPIIAMLHYPPLLHESDSSEMSALLEQYDVHSCVYGHIHGDKQSAFEGCRNGVSYLNSSMDRLGFMPRLLAECNPQLLWVQ